MDIIKKKIAAIMVTAIVLLNLLTTIMAKLIRDDPTTKNMKTE